jgi:hypothetical protein
VIYLTTLSILQVLRGASKDSIVDEQRIEKNIDTNDRGGLGKMTIKLSQESRCPSKDSKRIPLGYKSGAIKKLSLLSMLKYIEVLTQNYIIIMTKENFHWCVLDAAGY